MHWFFISSKLNVFHSSQQGFCMELNCFRIADDIDLEDRQHATVSGNASTVKVIWMGSLPNLFAEK
jgi:hypothetical protein